MRVIFPLADTDVTAPRETKVSKKELDFSLHWGM
jgi:hypothetical protein